MVGKSRRPPPPKSDGPDISILRLPIELGLRNIEQIAKCLESGSEEMKGLLLHECDIIFECRVCRNLFRGLPNFIAHKRVYCLEHVKNVLAEVFAEEETVVVQPEAPPEGSADTTVTEGEEGADGSETTPPGVCTVQPSTSGAEQKKTSLEHTVEKMQAGLFRGGSEAYRFYTKVVQDVQKRKDKKLQSILRLETIQGNPNAVMQSVQRDTSESGKENI